MADVLAACLTRLEQIRDAGWWDQATDLGRRVLAEDPQRLRRHLTPETVEWEQHVRREIEAPLSERSDGGPPPEKLQLDLLCLVARLEQVRDGGGWDEELLVADRVLTCDLPRLRKHLPVEAAP